MLHALVLPVLPSEELSGRCPETREGRLPRRGSPSGLATPISSFSLSSLEPKSLRMVILTIILVQVLCYHSITKITRNGINGAMFVTVGLALLFGELLHCSRDDVFLVDL